MGGSGGVEVRRRRLITRWGMVLKRVGVHAPSRSREEGRPEQTLFGLDGAGVRGPRLGVWC